MPFSDDEHFHQRFRISNVRMSYITANGCEIHNFLIASRLSSTPSQRIFTEKEIREVSRYFNVHVKIQKHMPVISVDYAEISLKEEINYVS